MMIENSLSDETEMLDALGPQIETLTKELTKLSVHRTRKSSQNTLLKKLTENGLPTETLANLVEKLTLNENVQLSTIEEFKHKAMQDKINHAKEEIKHANKAIKDTVKKLVFRTKGKHPSNPTVNIEISGKPSSPGHVSIINRIQDNIQTKCTKLWNRLKKDRLKKLKDAKHVRTTNSIINPIIDQLLETATNIAIKNKNTEAKRGKDYTNKINEDDETTNLNPKGKIALVKNINWPKMLEGIKVEDWELEKITLNELV